MRTLSRLALSIGAAATLLFGCAGSQPPIDMLGVSQPHTAAIQVEPDGSWMLPEDIR